MYQYICTKMDGCLVVQLEFQFPTQVFFQGGVEGFVVLVGVEGYKDVVDSGGQGFGGGAFDSLGVGVDCAHAQVVGDELAFKAQVFSQVADCFGGEAGRQVWIRLCQLDVGEHDHGFGLVVFGLEWNPV